MNRTFTNITFTFVTLLCLTACGQKAQLEAETAQIRASIEELTQTLKQVQAESEALGNLGSYNYPQQAHMDQLRARIKQLRDETVSLTAEKEKVRQDAQQLQKELDAYRAKHLN